MFAPGPELCFEDATSCVRHRGLAVARIGGWVVVLDVGCRLSGEGAELHLEGLSEDRDVHLVRLADATLYRHYRDGVVIQRADGDACRALVPGAQPDLRGEALAVQLNYRATGLSWDNLFDAQYTAFDLP